VDQGIISRNEMEKHPRKNELTNAIGIYPQVKPTISQTSIQAKQGDTFLLCTDGLNGMISDDEIRAILKSAKKLDLQSIQLVNQAKLAGGLDNVTVTIIGILKSSFTQTRLNGVDFYASVGNHKNKKSVFSQLWFQLTVAVIIPLLFFMTYGLISGSFELFTKEEPQEKEIQSTEQLTNEKEYKDSEAQNNKKDKNSENKKNLRGEGRKPTPKDNNPQILIDNISKDISKIEKEKKQIQSQSVQDSNTAKRIQDIEDKLKKLKNDLKNAEKNLKKSDTKEKNSTTPNSKNKK
jgi:hypothetical protein